MLNLQRCAGQLLVNTGKGDIQAIECDGEFHTQTGSGNVQVTSGSGISSPRPAPEMSVSTDPHEQCLSISTASGNVLVRDGTVLEWRSRSRAGTSPRRPACSCLRRGSMRIWKRARSGDIDLQGLEQKITRAVEDAIGKAGSRMNVERSWL